MDDAFPISVLISGGGTNLQAIIDAAARGDIPARIDSVVSDQQDGFQQIIQAFALFCGKRNDDRVPVPFIGNKADFRQLLVNPFRVGIGFINLIDGDNQGNLCGL